MRSSSSGDEDPRQAASTTARVIRMIPLQVARMCNHSGEEDMADVFGDGRVDVRVCSW